MSTNDVPGHNPSNRDALHGGCWAEHVDGTLLYVLGTEGKEVLYEIYEVPSTRKPTMYRDRMPLRDFETQFSYDVANPKSVKWTWHDKTMFPWDRVDKQFKSGVKPISAQAVIDEANGVKKTRHKYAGATKKPISKKRAQPAASQRPVAVVQVADEDDDVPVVETQAQRIARERALRPHTVEHADLLHKTEREMPKGGLATRIRTRIQGAIDRLKPGKGS